MKTEDCGKWRDALSESARSGEQPGGRLNAHLAVCPSCAERWNSERALSAELRELRAALAGERSADVWRLRLMAEFARMERPSARPWLRWAWVPACAALLMAAGAQLWLSMPGRGSAAKLEAKVQTAAAVSAPDADEDNGFIPVPYALPLAAGESVRVVRRELNGADLVRMGIDVPSAYAADLSNDFEANVVLGEDDLPRAVQLVTDVDPSADMGL
ncbi:MAG TPA: hypothetical protein VMU19_13190 [Bryobacteraceae bacterium]|nr:hypothetical protein [Bryobacteraceae bacterium]